MTKDNASDIHKHGREVLGREHREMRNPWGLWLKPQNMLLSPWSQSLRLHYGGNGEQSRTFPTVRGSLPCPPVYSHNRARLS